MLGWGIKPDVVSCTALISALGAEGQWERAEKVCASACGGGGSCLQIPGVTGASHSSRAHI